MNTPTTTKNPATRNVIDKRALTELQLAEDIAKAAQAPKNATALAESGITPTEVTDLLREIDACRILFTGSVDEREHKKSSTTGEASTESNLRRLLRGVQSAARLKYATVPDADTHLGDYFVGERITLSRASLATYSAGILHKLETDTLPGISPTRIAALRSAYEGWQELNATQASAQEAATQRRQDGLDKLEAIKEHRRRLQLAADVVFLLGDPAHFAARASFHLQPNKPFRG